MHHSIKRVKKKINDYILNNYNKLFFKNSNKTTPNTIDGTAVDNEQPDGKAEEQTLSTDEILSNVELKTKVEAELRLCEERDKAPRDLLQECVNELEEKGFLNCLE